MVLNFDEYDVDNFEDVKPTEIDYSEYRVATREERKSIETPIQCESTAEAEDFALAYSLGARNFKKTFEALNKKTRQALVLAWIEDKLPEPLNAREEGVTV